MRTFVRFALFAAAFSCVGCLSVSANPSTVTTAQGGTGTSAITVSGASGNVNLAAAGNPSGSSVLFSPATLTGSGTSTLTLSAGTAAVGTYSVSVSAANGGSTQSTVVTWAITGATQPDFALSASPTSVSSSGAPASTTLTVAASGGFSGAVSLAVGGLPAGATGAFSPATVNNGAGTSTLTLTPGTAAAGSYPLTVTGTSGALSHTASVTWTIAQTSGGGLQTVFMILLENTNWSSVSGSSSAPYINQTLLPMASAALNYNNPPGNHPSLPNYLWLEAGQNFGISADGDPSQYHQSTTAHLVTQLQNAGISWKSYQEDISGTDCPLTEVNLYATKHNPMVFFDDVTNTNDAMWPSCISHVRPYSELAGDLTANHVARYNFITPNLCDDGHDFLECGSFDTVKNTDTWLAANVPAILASSAYQNGGVLFITWDEGVLSDGPIGMIVLSPKAKGHGYTNTVPYTHSSTLRSIQEIFHVTPLLGDAANATDLGDLFTSFP